MKLYELSAKSHFKVSDAYHDEIFFLEKLDGMYSVCYNDKGELIHLSIGTPVIPIDKR